MNQFTSLILTIFIIFNGAAAQQRTRIGVKVFLEAAYENGVMAARLGNSGIIPSLQPYNTAPWNYPGKENLAPIPPGIVDWVLIQLRSDKNMNKVVSQKAGLLRSDGIVIDMDGKEGIIFPNLTSSKYYIVVIHRNHLSVMSAQPVSVLSSGVFYDFTQRLENTYGSDAVKLDNGKYAMYSGDADANGIINEEDLSVVGSRLFQAGYNQGDLDLNQTVNVLDYGKVNKSLKKASNVPAG